MFKVDIAEAKAHLSDILRAFGGRDEPPVKLGGGDFSYH